MVAERKSLGNVADLIAFLVIFCHPGDEEL